MYLFNSILMLRRLLILLGSIPILFFNQVNSSYSQNKQNLDNIRAAFPGRRVGGGTRGECSARSLVHLVPVSSTYSPGESGLIALLQGPSNSPVPVDISIKPYLENDKEKKNFQHFHKQLIASDLVIVLLNSPISNEPLIWESSFKCNDDSTDLSSDPFGFIQESSPPAVSLILPTPNSIDINFSNNLKWLSESCETKVPANEVSKRFKVNDLITSEWPKDIPVVCHEEFKL